MAVQQRTTAVGVFDNHAKARQTVLELRRAGFAEEQIGVISQDTEESRRAAADSGDTMASEGALAGAAAGAGIGTLWALAAAGGLMLPGIGPVLIGGGLLAALLAGAAGGAVLGGIVGALIGLGIPEEEAHYYEGELRSGQTLVTVRADDRYDDALAILRRHGSYDAEQRREATRTTEAVTAVPVAHEPEQVETVLHVAATRQQGPLRVDAPAEEGVQTRREPLSRDSGSNPTPTEHRSVAIPVQQEDLNRERTCAPEAEDERKP